MSPDAIADSVAMKISAALEALLPPLVERIVASAGVVGVPVQAAAKEPARPLVDIHAIAQFFGVSVVTVRRMVGEGMPVEWVASAMRFDVDECREWNRERGKRSVTKDPTGRKRTNAGPVGGVTLKSRSR